VDGFFAALFGSFVLSLVSSLLDRAIVKLGSTDSSAIDTVE
jgi:uncharacterized membrane protein YvlD (DUF360 family)